MMDPDNVDRHGSSTDPQRPALILPFSSLLLFIISCTLPAPVLSLLCISSCPTAPRHLAARELS